MFGKQDKMDVRCNSEIEASRVSKNGHKEGKESKAADGNISTPFLKDQQGTFSASGASEDCNKSKSSSADPDYCRRILVRGRGAEMCLCLFSWLFVFCFLKELSGLFFRLFVCFFLRTFGISERLLFIRSLLHLVFLSDSHF